MSELETSPPRPKRRILFRLFRGFLVLVVLLIVTYLVADQILLRKVQRQREAFKERFGAVDFRDFIPERPKPEEDAGRVYLYAAGLMAKVDVAHGDWSLFHALTQGPEAFKVRRGYESDNGRPTPEELEADVREKMGALDEAFTFVEKARGMARGAFLRTYEPVDMLPVLEEVRMLSRNIAAKAIFEARQGNLETAAAWLESGVHLAATLNEEPTLIAQMVRLALVELTTSAAEEVFNSTSVKVPLSDRYFDLLDSAARSSHFAKGLVSEAAYTMSYPVPGPRLFWSINHSKTLEITDRIANAVQLPASPERLGELTLIAKETTGLSVIHVVARMAVPNLVRSALQQDRMATRCGMVRIAQALRNHKIVKGSYPESLHGLANSIGSERLIVPLSGEPLSYRREGEGFVLYSVGPDQKDDGGTETEKRNTGDIVWTCVR